MSLSTTPPLTQTGAVASSETRAKTATVSKSYRILAIAPTPFFVDRGGHVQIYEQARALMALGHTLELCTYHIGRDMPGLTSHRIRNVRWYSKTDAGPAWGKLYLMVLLFFLSWRTVRRFKPDIMHGHGWDGCWIAFALHLLTGVPFVFDMQGSFTGEIVAHGYAKNRSLFFRLLKWIERRTLHLGAVVTQSEQMRDDAIRDFHVQPDRIYHTYDGVDTDDLQPNLAADPQTIALREALHLPADKPVIVFLGLLKAYQGVDVLLEAIQLLTQKRQYTNVHFLVMGFPDEDKYAAKARELGIGDFASFPGRIDYKRRKYYYALGAAAVAPKLSLTEGDGKIYDYLAMGLPIIAFDRPASKEILGDLAFFATLGDPQSLAEALYQALTNTERAKQLGVLGRALAVERYSWLAVGRRLTDAYTDVISKNKRR